MEEIKAPKKERKFLKAMGEIGLNLLRYLLLDLGKKVINKVGNKRQGLVIAFALVTGISYASIDSIPYPVTGNKQRLGWQTSGNGLVYRGRSNDTITKPSSYVDKNVKAYLLLDSVRGTIFVWRQTYWDSILVGGGSFAQPIDSLFFNTSVPTNNVDTAKMRWDSDLATVVLGLYDNVPNELGFKNFWLVKNQTGSTITKGSLVYANGTVGASGRITVAKFIANGSIDAKYLLGITAHDLTDGEDGYVVSFGKIRQVNTDTFAAGAILYPSPTVAGVWTDVEPIAPNIDMPIGFCINSHVNNGTIAIRVASGYKLSELHDVSITLPVDKASLYYSGGLWRDTTEALLVSDTASMLANYATKAYADTSGRFYARQDFTNVSSSTLTWTQSDTLVVGGVNVVQVYRNGQILLPTQYTIPTNASVVIGATAYKVGENYTVIFPRGGGGGGGSGSGSLTSISGGTGIIVNPNPITTTGTVSADTSFLFTQSDTLSLNLISRFASKLNAVDTASLSTRIDAKGTGTVTSVGSGFGLLGGTITTTGTLRLDTTTIYARLQDSINVAIGNDTIKILKQEYNPALSSILTWTITPKFPIQLKAYILVFRNGQLLNNDQYNLTDTNKITIVSTSFKVGANYTVATVSGIGSVGTGIYPNPIYPEAGIAVSTGTTWTTSIPNNSSNWNTAFSDRLKWDGGSTDLVASTGRTSLGGTTIGQSMFTLTNPSAITFPRFNADNSISSLTAANFRSAIGAGTVISVNASTTSGNPISIDNNTTTPTIELLSATSARNGYLTSTDWTTFNNKQNTLSNASSTVSGILTSTDWNTFNNKQNTITLTTTGTSGAATLIGSTLNIPQYSGGGGGTGTVTSVGLTVPSIFNVSGSPVTTSGTLALTYSGTALPLLNGGTGATTADGALTNLGASAQGKLLFNLTNSTSDKFIKVNTDNTITLLNAADTRTAIGAGVGTVTNVSGTGAISVSNGTTTPSISVASAAFGTAGIVTATGTQQFSGDKTFEGIVQFNARAVFKDYTYQATRLAGLSSTDRLSTVILGTGLTLSGGVLSATGDVTSVTASSPLSSSGGTTPNITITDASASVSGVVNTTTQSFAGNKTFTGTINVSSTGTFGGRVNTPWLERTYTSSTSSSFTVSVNTTWLDINTNVLTTITLPNAATYPGKELHIRQTGTGQVQSASSNVIPFTSPPTGSAGTSIFNPTNNKAVTLVSDGVNWIIMQRSTN